MYICIIVVQIEDETDYQGNKFCIAFLLNAGGSGSGGAQLSLHISTDEGTVGYNITYRIGQDYTTLSNTANKGEVTVIPLPSDLEVRPEDTAAKAVIVQAEQGRSIAVYGFSDTPSSTDAFLALPVRKLSGLQEYIYYTISSMSDSSASPQTVGQSMLSLVGCEDDTEVTVQAPEHLDLLIPIDPDYHPHLESGSTVPGTHPFTLRPINYLDNFHFQSNQHDLTGFRVTSSKPVGFMTGHTCGTVPLATPQCDYQTEQVPPSYTWGYTFILQPFAQRPNGYNVKIIARTDTAAMVVCASDSVSMEEYNLTAHEALSFSRTGEERCSVQSENPLLVMQYAQGFSNDDGYSGQVPMLGDPFLVTISPVNLYSNNYTITTGSSGASNFLNIAVSKEDFDPAAVVVNGNVSVANWQEVYCKGDSVCGYVSTVAVEKGTLDIRHLNSSAGISVIAYGWGNEKGYGYSAGYKLDPIGGEWAATHYTVPHKVCTHVYSERLKLFREQMAEYSNHMHARS